MYKVNRTSLTEALKELFYDAGRRGVRYSGECHLYGEYDEDGVITHLFIHEFAGSNSWLSGDDIVMICRRQWFDPMEYEDEREWLRGELENNPVLLNDFKGELQARGEEYDPHSFDTLHTFQEIFPETYEEFLNHWRETWLQDNVDGFIDEVILMLKRDGWTISDDVPEAKFED